MANDNSEHNNSEQDSGERKSLNPATRRFIELGVVALVVVLLSILGTLLALGVVKLPGMQGGSDDGKPGRASISLTDAFLECEEYAKDELGSRIKYMFIDNHSSRYDERSNRFKIFLEADLFAEGASSGTTKHYYINCFSRANRLSITTFEIMEDRTLPARPVRESKNTNAFGM